MERDALTVENSVVTRDPLQTLARRVWLKRFHQRPVAEPVNFIVADEAGGLAMLPGRVPRRDDAHGPFAVTAADFLLQDLQFTIIVGEAVDADQLLREVEVVAGLILIVRNNQYVAALRALAAE